MAQPIVDFSTFPSFRYSNADIQTVIPYREGSPKPTDLEGITNSSEIRVYLFYVKLKDKGELLVKPYLSEQERAVISLLHNSEISGVIGFNQNYFVEEGIRTPSIDSALQAKAIYLEEKAAGLFGKALLQMHQRGVVYGKRFNNRVFVDDITGKIKISDFSKAQITDELSARIVDLTQALNYMESLASIQDMSDKQFFTAVRNFKSGYALYEDGKRVFEGAAQYFLSYLDSQSRIVRAIKQAK